jgi:hypothetical protein
VAPLALASMVPLIVALP